MHLIRLYLKAYGGITPPAWMLAFVLLVNRSGSMVLPFLSIYLKEEMSFSLQQVGIILTLFGLGSLCGSMLGGYLTDKLGTFKVQFGSLVLGGIGFILLQRVESFEGLALGFFGVTVLTDALRPANATAVAEYAKKENITRAYSLNRMAVNLGFSFGPVAGGLLAAIDYKWLFYVDGITCIVAGLIFAAYFYNKQPRNQHQSEETPPQAEKPKSPFKDVSYLAFACLTAGFGIVFFQLFNTLPLYYRDGYQLSEQNIGWLLGLNGFIVFLVEMPLVYALGTKYSLRSLVAVGVILSGASFILFNMATGMVVLFVSMFILSISEILVMPYLTTYTANRSTKATRGKYMGLYGMAYSVSFIFAPALGTFLINYSGFSLLWYVMGGISIAVAIGFMVNMREVHASPDISTILESAEKELEKISPD